MNHVFNEAMARTPPYPPATRGQVVVWGLLGAYPFGGMTWQVLHYVVGLRLLGFDVWYVEDSDRFVYSARDFARTAECEANIAYLHSFLSPLGLGDRWIFRLPKRDRECVGARDYAGLLDLYRSCDAAFNICGAQEVREDHTLIGPRVYVETDPVESQVKVASGDHEKLAELRQYQHRFTYGERIGTAGCRIPETPDLRWHATRPPVLIEWWSDGGAAGRTPAALTTIAKWEHSGKDVEWRGERWRWSKHHEFNKLAELPRRVSLPLEIAVSSISDSDALRLKNHGWRLVPSSTVKGPLEYRSYIQGSLGEFTVAKEQYVLPVSGWFSDRSVCYLAAGRPVITQETGFSEFLPTGAGLLAYRNEPEAAEAIERVASDYEVHSQAALSLAEEAFGVRPVLASMLSTIGIL